MQLLGSKEFPDLKIWVIKPSNHDLERFPECIMSLKTLKNPFIKLSIDDFIISLLILSENDAFLVLIFLVHLVVQCQLLLYQVHLDGLFVFPHFQVVQ